MRLVHIRRKRCRDQLIALAAHPLQSQIERDWNAVPGERSEIRGIACSADVRREHRSGVTNSTFAPARGDEFGRRHAGMGAVIVVDDYVRRGPRPRQSGHPRSMSRAPHRHRGKPMIGHAARRDDDDVGILGRRSSAASAYTLQRIKTPRRGALRDAPIDDAHDLAPARKPRGDPDLPARLGRRLEQDHLVPARAGDARRLEAARAGADDDEFARGPRLARSRCGMVGLAAGGRIVDAERLAASRCCRCNIPCRRMGGSRPRGPAMILRAICGSASGRASSRPCRACRWRWRSAQSRRPGCARRGRSECASPRGPRRQNRDAAPSSRPFRG